MPRLNVNIDHIATLRQARRGNEPDPIFAAYLAEIAGADGIVVHLRQDRRHIQERDLRMLRKTVKTKLNVEMAPTEEMVQIAQDVRPDVITLVPERREEITTEGGLNVVNNYDTVSSAIQSLKDDGLSVSLFIDPDPAQVNASKKAGADVVEMNTGIYAETRSREKAEAELEKIEYSVKSALELGLSVSAGHGLDYRNVGSIAAVKGIEELNVGFSIIARSVIVGFERAVREMVELLR